MADWPSSHQSMKNCWRIAGWGLLSLFDPQQKKKKKSSSFVQISWPLFPFFPLQPASIIRALPERQVICRRASSRQWLKKRCLLMNLNCWTSPLSTVKRQATKKWWNHRFIIKKSCFFFFRNYSLLWGFFLQKAISSAGIILRTVLFSTAIILLLFFLGIAGRHFQKYSFFFCKPDPSECNPPFFPSFSSHPLTIYYVQFLAYGRRLLQQQGNRQSASPKSDGQNLITELFLVIKSSCSSFCKKFNDFIGDL